jgi:hypothetical protein
MTKWYTAVRRTSTQSTFLKHPVFLQVYLILLMVLRTRLYWRLQLDMLPLRLSNSTSNSFCWKQCGLVVVVLYLIIQFFSQFMSIRWLMPIVFNYVGLLCTWPFTRRVSFRGSVSSFMIQFFSQYMSIRWLMQIVFKYVSLLCTWPFTRRVSLRGPISSFMIQFFSQFMSVRWKKWADYVCRLSLHVTFNSKCFSM